jgi:transcription termination/antitermination protein NusA
MSAIPPEAGEVVNLFKARVPQLESGLIAIRGAVRDPGNRTILVVSSTDPAVDSVGACVGNRGAIVKEIVNELHREYIDIVRWSDSPKTFITNLLGLNSWSPLRRCQVSSVSLDETTHEATAVLSRDSDPPPSDRVRLQSQLLRDLTGWVLRLEMEH